MIHKEWPVQANAIAAIFQYDLVRMVSITEEKTTSSESVSGTSTEIPRETSALLGCVICQELDCEIVVFDDCGHISCKNCVRSNSCPICRKEIIVIISITASIPTICPSCPRDFKRGETIQPIIFGPCGHLIGCKQCTSLKLSRCPTCKSRGGPCVMYPQWQDEL